VVGWSATDRPGRATQPRPAIVVVGRDGEKIAAPPRVEVEVGASPRYFRLYSAGIRVN
jgi:hypothetical protein